MKTNRIQPIQPIPRIPKNPPKRKQPEPPKPPKKKGGRPSFTKQISRKALEHWSCDIKEVLNRLNTAVKYKYASTKDEQIEKSLIILKDLYEYVTYWRDVK